MEHSIKSVVVRIKGRVQGVWFRAWTADKATALGLSGWVRNRHDGTVEALFSGPQDKVDIMVVKCGKGPILARVDAVQVDPASPPNELEFQKRETV